MSKVGYSIVPRKIISEVHQAGCEIASAVPNPDGVIGIEVRPYGGNKTRRVAFDPVNPRGFGRVLRKTLGQLNP